MGLETSWWIPNRRTGGRGARLTRCHAVHAGNIFLGYLSILASFRGAMMAATGGAGAAEQLGSGQGHRRGGVPRRTGRRIARMTNTTSDFGREMDSLADV